MKYIISLLKSRTENTKVYTSKFYSKKYKFIVTTILSQYSYRTQMLSQRDIRLNHKPVFMSTITAVWYFACKAFLQRDTKLGFNKPETRLLVATRRCFSQTWKNRKKKKNEFYKNAKRSNRLWAANILTKISVSQRFASWSKFLPRCFARTLSYTYKKGRVWLGRWA